MSGHPFSPVPHPKCDEWRHAPGGEWRPGDGVYNREEMSQERRVGDEMERKTK